MLLLAVVAVVFLTPGHAQSQERAKAIEVQGQVSVLRGGQVALFQNGTARANLQNSTVGANEEIVTGPDGYAVFQISDGSTFKVFPNSRVTFQAKWTVEDMLELILGKIQVQIEHRNGPNHKKVSTPTALISVRGTVFDVAVEDDDGTTYVGVEEGQVEVRHLLQPTSTPKTLNQNEWIRIYPNQPLAKAGSPNSGAVKFVFDRVRAAVEDIIFHNPGGVGLPGGGTPGVPGAQGDGGKTKKGPPSGNPPGAPPPPPGGGN
jgi:ferric-dicitrate binding protein FerR (iron transport regulator)